MDESLIATCEHHITKRLLSHGGMWTQHNPRVSLGIIYYDIKRILLTNLQYYQKFWIQVFSLYLDSLTVLVLLNCYYAHFYKCKIEKHVAEIDVVCDHLFCDKSGTLLSSLYVHLTQCTKLFPKHFEANFKHLFKMELVTDIIFLIISSVNNDSSIYLFDTGVCCEMSYVGNTELKDIP